MYHGVLYALQPLPESVIRGSHIPRLLPLPPHASLITLASSRETICPDQFPRRS
jgi:hypothetical protein